MRNIFIAIAIAILVMTSCLACAAAILQSQPAHASQLHNPYWPFSVETSVKDR